MMDARSLKAWLCLACLAVSMAAPYPAPSPQLYLDIIDMAAISRMTPQQLEKLAEGLAAEEIMRTKRSSAQAVTSVVSKASSGIQSKIGLLGQASAFITSASSKSGGDEHHGYSYEPAHHHDEKYDYWGLKKSILYTLFQAVKAITGGVTILKGQLIKGGGALASTLGKVIGAKGDAVSNLGKKIVSSAALSEKKPHSSAVYGPPPTSHIEYGPPPAVYGAPTAPAHYHTGPSLPTGYAAHKYPATLDELIVMSSVADEVIARPMPEPSQELIQRYYDLVNEICDVKEMNVRYGSPSHRTDFGRGKLSGVHAGLVFLAPLAEHGETLETAHSAHTPLEPPSSVLNTVFSAIKTAFSTVAAPAHTAPSAPGLIEEPYAHQPPPPPQPVPEFKPMEWASPALNSYGEPAATDAYSDYDPRNPYPPFDYGTAKHSAPVSTHKTGLTAEKIQKINFNIQKLNNYMNQQARSSEVLPKFNGLELMKNGPIIPTPVVTDNEIGVLPAELLDLNLTTSTSTTSTSTSTPTTELPQTTTVETRRRDYKYFLRGNRIVLV